MRGAPFDLFIAGARIDANYPLGPVAGTAFNATVLSVAGSLDIGIHTDAGAVDDPEALRDAIEASLRRAARRCGRTPRRRDGRRTGLRSARLSWRRARGRRQQDRADVEQQVGDLVGGHQLAVEHVAETRDR